MPSHDEGRPLLNADALACHRGGRSLFEGLSFELAPGLVLELQMVASGGDAVAPARACHLQPGEAA